MATQETSSLPPDSSTPPATVADLPTGDPTPSSSFSESTTAPSRRTPLTNLDAFLSHLHKCLATPQGIDTVLLFLCYTSRLSSSLLSYFSRFALHRSAKAWIALVSALPPRTTILFSSSPVKGGAAMALVLSQRLKALSGLLSEARTTLRLWGLLGMYFWGKRLVLRSLKHDRDRDDKDKSTALDAAIAWTQLITCVLFQALENGAYLSSKGVLGWSAEQQGRALKWSSRFWGAYVGVELGRLVAEKVGGRVAAKGEREERVWKNAVMRNLAWAPLTVHWGSDKGVVQDWMVGALASIPGWIQMTELWRETA